jgi:cell wall-associated NlpC family hydrolase
LQAKGSRWLKIQSLHDGYEGWLTRNMLAETTEVQAKAKKEFVTTEIISKISIGEKSLNIPVASTLPGLKDGTGGWGSVNYRYEANHLDRFRDQPDLELLEKFTSPWMNTPYMWGGRTPLGVDCSGFVQVNFKMLGFDLPRDAWQQAQEGNPVKKLKESLPGDLAFFDDKDEIVHVGILLNPEQILHASGNVRIDPIDKKGIIHAETGKRTHRLELIRRIW